LLQNRCGIAVLTLHYTPSNLRWVYAIYGNNLKGSSIAKLDSLTLELLQTFDLPAALYIGGLLIHSNGHIYCMHSNTLIAFWDGDLTNYTSLKVPYTTLNGNLVQTNGMLVTQDGYLVIKQWSMVFEDLGLLVVAQPLILKLLLGLMIVAATGFYLRRKETNTYTGVVVRGAVVGGFIFLAIILLFIRTILGNYDPLSFMTSSLVFYGGGGGELKIVDPISLLVVASAVLTERCSYARMAMVALESDDGHDEDAIVMLGDENVVQFRWRPSKKQRTSYFRLL
jgi:hypothetical protein